MNFDQGHFDRADNVQRQWKDIKHQYMDNNGGDNDGGDDDDD